MSTFDYSTLFLYIFGVFIIGIISARRTRDQDEMFTAGGQAPWWASGLSGFMTMFSAGTFVVWGGIAYRLGIVAVLINICYGIAALLVGYFIAGRWNQMGIATPAEYIRLRFGKVGLHFYTWTMMLRKLLAVGVSLYSLAILLIVLIPLEVGNPFRDPSTGNLSLTWAIGLFGIIVVFYTMLGGLWAVLMTDVVQFIILTLVVCMVAVLMFQQVGDVNTFLSGMPETFFSPTNENYGWTFLAGWVIINFFMIGAEWAFVQRFLSVKSPVEARKSAYLFGGMYLISPLFWLLPPLLYRGINANANPEQAYILAAQEVLPIGVLGLMFAAMFSATASMVSSQLNVFAGVLTQDFYRALLNPQATSKVLVKIGRMFTGLIGLTLTVLALLVPNMGGAEKVIISINSLLVVPLLAPALWGIFSRRINLTDMLIVVLFSFAVGATVRFGIGIQNSTIDVMIGVLLPLSMLGIIEWLKKDVLSPGYIALKEHQERAEKNITNKNTRPIYDPFPGKIVMVSLIVCALSLVFLAALSHSGQGTIVVFASILLLISGGIGWRMNRLKKSLNTEAHDN